MDNVSFKKRRDSHSLVGNDAISTTRLELAHNLARSVHLDAAQDIFGPGNPAVVGRIPRIAQVDVSAHTTTASTTLGAGPSSATTSSTAAASESGCTAFASLLGKEGASRS